MNISKQSPTYILTACLKDLFWNNNSDLYPNIVPPRSEYTYHFKTRPVFQSPYVGTCILQGEWNHAFYDGNYYFLKKIGLKDKSDDVFIYQLVYDVMMNFLLIGGEIKGTLVRTNRPEILDKVVQTCQPILNDPPIINYINFDDIKKYNWKESCKLILPENREKFQEWYITYRDWEYFVYRTRISLLGKGLKSKSWKPTDKADTNNFDRRNIINPLYITDYLPKVKFLSWKDLILKEIKDNFTDLSDKVISQQTQITGSYFTGKKTITWKEGGIGSTQETDTQIESIDLSGLEDIVPIDDFNKPLEPTELATINDLLDDDIPSNYQPFKVIKLGRTPYLPLYNGQGEIDKNAFIPTPYTGLTDNTETTGYTGNHPQTILFNDKADVTTKNDKKIGYLWYLNRNNFSLIGFDWKQWTSKEPTKDYLKNKLITTTWSDHWKQYFFNRLDRKNIPSLGFIIFQLLTDRFSWDDYEYIGSQKLKSISYRSGLTNELNKTYGDKSRRWWHNTPKEVMYMNGVEELSALTLDTNLMTWLTIVPSSKNYPYYKYYWNNRRWGIPQIFKGRNEGWVAKIMNFDIDNIEKVSNPLSNDKITNWLVNREKKLQKVSLETRINIPELTKGDILASSLEYQWMDVQYYDLELPLKLTPADISNYLTHLRDFKYVAREHRNRHFTYWGETPIDPNVGTTGLKITTSGAVLTVVGGTLLWNPVGWILLTIGSVLSLTGSSSLLSDVINEQSIISGIKNSALLTSDFFGSERVNIKDLRKCIITYLHKGKVKFGFYDEIDTEFTLSNSDEQIVESVDGVSKTSITLYSIKQVPDVTLDYTRDDVFSPENQNKLLQYAFANIRGSKNGRIFEYTKERLSQGTHRFDLKGTKWTVVFYNGKPHLVAKNDSVFINPNTQTAKLKYLEPKSPSVYDRINQKAELLFYGQSFPLNTKFTFKEDEQFNLNIQEIPHKDKISPTSQYHLTARNNHDHINTWIKLDKPPVDISVKEFDPVEYELMKHQLEKTNLDYIHDKSTNEMVMERRKLEMIRRREDLNIDWWSKVLGASISGISGSVYGAAWLTRNVPHLAHGMYPFQKGAFAAKKTAGIMAGVGKLSTLGVGLGVPIIQSYRYGLQKQRLKEDEEIMYRENAQEMFHRKQNYEHEYRNQIMRLNSLTRTYIRGGINDREIQEAFNKNNNITNINIQILLPTQEQSRVISHVYDTFGCECVSDEFKYTPLVVKSGQIEGLYQFENMLADSVISTLSTDLYVNETIRLIFTNGTKFTQTIHESIPKKIDEVFVIEEEEKPVFNTSDITNWSREEWDYYYWSTDKDEILKTIKGLDKFGLTDKEKEANPDVVNTPDDKLLNKINEIIHNRESGKVYIIPPTKEIEVVDVEKLKEVQARLDTCIADRITLQDQLRIKTEELEALKSTQTTLTGDKDKCIADLAQKQAEIDNLKNQITSKDDDLDQYKDQVQRLRNQLNAKDDEIEQLKASDKSPELSTIKQQLNKKKEELKQVKARLETANDELRKCKIDFSNLNQAKQFCDATNTAFIKELEKQKKQCEADLAAKKAELDLIKSGVNVDKQTITNKEQEISQCNQKVDELTKQLNEAKGDHTEKVKQLEDQIKSLQQQKENLENQKTEIERQLREEIRRHKVDKESIEQQLNDERRRAINEKDEINRLKKELEEAKKVPKGSTNTLSCEMVKKLFNIPYEIPMKEDNNGWTEFRKLNVELANNLIWLRTSGLDQKLSSTPQIKEMIKRLEELEEIPVIDKTIELIKSPGWKDYLKWIQNGGTKNANVETIIGKNNELSKLETTPMAHSVKNLMDELNYMAISAQEELKDQIETNQDIEFFFRHAYPGKLTSLYENAFGDPKLALTRKKFVETVQCEVGEGGMNLDTITNIYNSTKIIPPKEIRPTVEPPKETTPTPEEQPVEVKPSTPEKIIPVMEGAKLTDNLNIFINVYPEFFNVADGERNTYVEGTLNQYGMPRYVTTFYNYGYRRYLKNDNSYYFRHIWVKLHRLNTNTHSKSFYLQQEELKQPRHQDIYNNVKTLWENKDRITLDPEFVRKVREKEVTLELEFNYVNVGDFDTDNIVGVSKANPLVFYTNSNNNQVESWGEHLEDLLKLLFILGRNSITLERWGQDTQDNWDIWRFNIRSGADIDRYYKNLGAEGTSEKNQNGRYVFRLGMLFWGAASKISDYVKNNKLFLPGETRLGWSTAYAIYSYIWRLINNPGWFEHPWKMDGGGAWKLLEATHKIAKKY